MINATAPRPRARRRADGAGHAVASDRTSRTATRTRCARRRFCVSRRGGVLAVEHDLRARRAVRRTRRPAGHRTRRHRRAARAARVRAGVHRRSSRPPMDGGRRRLAAVLPQLARPPRAAGSRRSPRSTRTPRRWWSARASSTSGSCFGFFPLRMAAAGFDVMATDLSAPTMDLLDRISASAAAAACARWRATRPTFRCRTAPPTPSPSLHLLEHLDAATPPMRCSTRPCALARRRVVVAVPVRGRTARVLRARPAVRRRPRCGDGRRALRSHAGVSAGVHEFHGGWLVLDR